MRNIPSPNATISNECQGANSPLKILTPLYTHASPPRPSRLSYIQYIYTYCTGRRPLYCGWRIHVWSHFTASRLRNDLALKSCDVLLCRWSYEYATRTAVSEKNVIHFLHYLWKFKQCELHLLGRNTSGFSKNPHRKLKIGLYIRALKRIRPINVENFECYRPIQGFSVKKNVKQHQNPQHSLINAILYLIW